jgi:hypothetical protein
LARKEEAVAAGAKTEVHHRVPRSLLSAHDRMTECAELDGAALQAWYDFEEECHRHGVSPDLSRGELEAVIEGSTVEVSREEHRGTIHAADWPRWGRMGGLRVLELYGPRYFVLLALRRHGKVTVQQLREARPLLSAKQERSRRSSTDNAATALRGCTGSG